MFNLVDGSAKFSESVCRSEQLISIGKDGSFSVLDNPKRNNGSPIKNSLEKCASPP